MFGLFSTAIFSDPELGELKFARRRWRGRLHLAGADVPIAIQGSRKLAAQNAIEAARRLQDDFAAFRPQIEAALFEHYKFYADAVASGDLRPPAEGAIEVMTPGDVWRHAAIQFVSIASMSAALVTELGLAVDWDDEHIVGARFDGKRFIELCGSTVPW